MTPRPRARFEGLVVEQREDGSIIHDPESGRSHRLDWVATTVWSLANGRRTLVEIAEAAEVPVDAASVAVEALADMGLLSDAIAADADGALAERRNVGGRRLARAARSRVGRAARDSL
jgi:hypothetical protein